ncbi:MAG: GDP-mannose dehydrogenase [Alphaproteobacteria bacterium]|nr:GDP-mannose dehydrogenase [Alphaproteobacteria bacterium]
MPVIGFAGMTHLGLISAFAAAARGFPVFGYDEDPAVTARLQKGDIPITEPGLDGLLAAGRVRLSFAADVATLRDCDVVYISADVPTDDWGKSDLAPIERLIAHVARQLRDDAILVVLCQVPPGFTRALGVVPHERLIYQVETLVFGQAVPRALNPERFIVGCADPARPLPEPYRKFLESFCCPILTMRYESAELAKISINFCLVGQVTVANTLAELSEAIGADWSEIVPALRLDRRIGAFAYLTPGLGIAGGNLERDLQTVIELGARAGTDTGVVTAWIANSRHRKEWCWRVLETQVFANKSMPRIAVFGLAYKENTHSTKNSPSLTLLNRLRGRAELCVHDPVVPTSIVAFAAGSTDALSCAEGADALVLATPWPEYRSLRICDLARAMRGRVLVDPFRLLPAAEAVAAGFAYHALGMPPLLQRFNEPSNAETR